MKSTYAQNNYTAGEISPRALGRFDLAKYSNALKVMENFIGYQLGGAVFRPGTKYVAAVKTSSLATRLLRFQYSTTQSYIVEAGNLYFRFYANGGVVESAPSTPAETVTVYPTAILPSLKYAQNADVMYIASGTYAPYKLQRTSATTFTMTIVSFVRGPFLDTNITATTITPSADTGAGITLTASSAIFLSTHIGSLWRVKSGVVKVTAFTDTTHVTATVQAEPTGVAGNLATGPGASADWAEGAWSDYRGWPKCVTFHEGRLYFANTSYQPQAAWGSVPFAYENHTEGADDDDAVSFEMNTEQVNAIRWLSSSTKALQAGTSGGTFTISSGTQNTPITPTTIIVQRDTIYGAADLDAKRIGSYLYYVQRDLDHLRELGYSFDIDASRASDTNLLADHVLKDGDGAVDLDQQQSPNDRIWVVRDDGQIAVLTRNVEQEVQGWARIISGADETRGAGLFESIAILPQENAPDQIWVIVNRYINGAVKRYVEYFTDEDFDDDWDAVRLDSSLTLDSPKTISGATKANPVVITATSHGFSNGDQVKIDNIVGRTAGSNSTDHELNTNIYLVANKTANTFELTDTDGENINGTAYATYVSGGEVRKMVTAISGLSHLEGETVTVQVDGGLPSGAQTYSVASGAITLEQKAAVVHVGLAYEGTLQMLKMSDGDPQTGQTKQRSIIEMIIRLYRSCTFKVGAVEDYLDSAFFDTPNQPLGHAAELFTGDKRIRPNTSWDSEIELIIRQDKPLPLTVICAVIESQVEDIR